METTLPSILYLMCLETMCCGIEYSENLRAIDSIYEKYVKALANEVPASQAMERFLYYRHILRDIADLMDKVTHGMREMTQKDHSESLMIQVSQAEHRCGRVDVVYFCQLRMRTIFASDQVKLCSETHIFSLKVTEENKQWIQAATLALKEIVHANAEMLALILQHHQFLDPHTLIGTGKTEAHNISGTLSKCIKVIMKVHVTRKKQLELLQGNVMPKLDALVNLIRSSSHATAYRKLEPPPLDQLLANKDLLSDIIYDYAIQSNKDECENRDNLSSVVRCASCLAPAPPRTLLQCACMHYQALYCSRECQKKHRSKHKENCMYTLRQQELELRKRGVNNDASSMLMTVMAKAHQTRGGEIVMDDKTKVMVDNITAVLRQAFNTQEEKKKKKKKGA